MKVAVLGSSGGMGSFLARYFVGRGDEVRGADPKPGRPGSGGFPSFRNNSEAVRGCDFAFLAVPMDRTIAVAREVAPALGPGATLVEISSVKGRALDELKRVVGKRAALLSIHPLFGPALESTRGMKVAVIVSRKGGKEAEEARRLFPEARIIPMSRREHDRAMAAVLSLTHLVNLVYAGTVARLLSPEEFMRVSTPNSSMQLTLAQAVLAQDSKLSYEIQANNPYSRRAARAAARELRRVTALVEGRDMKGFEKAFERLAKAYELDRRAGAVVKEIYSAAEKAV